MGRPKGSKKKKKETTTTPEEPVKFTTKSDVVPEVPVEQSWKPEPDMGKVQPPPPAEKACACGHKGGDHHGGPKGWCNTQGCRCQEFQ